MAWQTPLDKSLFSLDNNAPPPQLLNFQQQPQPLPQYQPPQININPLTNPTAKGVYDGIVNQKLLWNRANDEENFLQQHLNSGKYNDEQNQYMQNQIGLLRFQKDEAAKAADSLRNTARGLNIDTAGFNANNTLDEALQNKMNYDARAIQGLMNLQSTSQQQENYYNQMLDAGLSPRLARIAANQKLNEFRENNVNQLFNGFQNYGLNDDGSINNFGINLLGKLANEDPQAVALFSNTFATPKESFAEMNTNYRQNLAADNQRQTNLANMQNDWAKLRAIQDFTRQERQAQEEHAAKMKVLDSLVKGTGVAQDKMAQEIQNLVRLGIPEDKAKELYLAQHYSNALKILNGDSEIMKDEQKFANFIDGYWGNIEHFLEVKNYEQAQALINDFREKLLSDDFKYAEVMNSQRAKYFLSKLDLYEKVAKNEMSFEEMQAYMQGRNASVADFSRISNDKYANEKARQIANANAKRRTREKEKEQSYTYEPPKWFTNEDALPH